VVITIKCPDTLAKPILAQIEMLNRANDDQLDYSFVLGDGTEPPKRKRPGGGKPTGPRTQYLVTAIPEREKKQLIKGLSQIKMRILTYVAEKQAEGETVTKPLVMEYFGIPAPSAERDLGRLVAAGLLQSVPIVNRAAEGDDESTE
jgi:hypothetical protein